MAIVTGQANTTSLSTQTNAVAVVNASKNAPNRRLNWKPNSLISKTKPWQKYLKSTGKKSSTLAVPAILKVTVPPAFWFASQKPSVLCGIRANPVSFISRSHAIRKESDMRNKPEQQVTKHKTYNYKFTPAITTIAFPLLIAKQKTQRQGRTKQLNPENIRI